MLKDAQICLITPMSFGELREYYNSFHLGDFKNIMVAQDYKFSFYNFFKIKAFPYVAIYDGQKKLVKLYKEEISIDRILKGMRA